MTSASVREIGYNIRRDDERDRGCSEREAVCEYGITPEEQAFIESMINSME